MSITLNDTIENEFINIYKIVKYAILKLNINIPYQRGRKHKYSDLQIILCLIYRIKNSIFSFRELEYRLKRDNEFCNIIGLQEIPDYSTLSIRARKIEFNIFNAVYAMLIKMINPNTRLCAIDSTPLRSSRYDKEAKIGKGTRLGMYKGYKLHCLASVTDSIIPLAFTITTANIYDSKIKSLLYEATMYEPFLILADAAYDSNEWFSICESLHIKLLADINIRKAKSIEVFNEIRYQNALFKKSIIGEKLYKNRLKIEQLFSILKGQYHIENVHLYGKKRYFNHVKWTLMCYLIDEYKKKVLNIKSRKYPWNEECR